ncbi:Uncharacterised protein [Klebsiella variicola]|uniref:Uncharacterized protein n=1 Tax=Klebsiella variicola TaxID=244366 RepID=A0ABD7PDY1_KLEVA|nr:Uncharacterised protein [Klebsiella variicola]
MPCTAWAEQKWITIPRSYLVMSRIDMKIANFRSSFKADCQV